LILIIDLIEHLEDYFKFLREIKLKSKYKILRIPLDLSVQTIFRVTPILQVRKSVGHIHYYTKEIALEVLKDTGYEVLDYMYVTKSMKRTIQSHIARIPRKLSFVLNKDLAVRAWGGYSLLVLAK
jgi:hypothetical protein